MSIPSSVSVSHLPTVGQQKGGKSVRGVSLNKRTRFFPKAGVQMDLHPQFTYSIGLDSLVMQVM